MDAADTAPNPDREPAAEKSDGEDAEQQLTAAEAERGYSAAISAEAAQEVQESATYRSSYKSQKTQAKAKYGL